MYNEEAGVAACLNAVDNILSTAGFGYRIVAVDDGSRDATPDLLDALKAKLPNLMVVTNGRNLGYGKALWNGAREASVFDYEYLLFMDSDLTNDPADLPKFFAKMDDGCDFIKGSRYHRDGIVVGVPLWRRAISAAGNLLARPLFGLPLTDFTSGYRAFRREIVEKLMDKVQERAFAVIMEEIYYAQQFTRSFVEVPTSLSVRTRRQRPSSFSYRPEVLWDYLKYPLKRFASRITLFCGRRGYIRASETR